MGRPDLSTTRQPPLAVLNKLTNFVNRRFESCRVDKEKKDATGTEYQELRARLNKKKFLAPLDSDNTRASIYYIKMKFIRFCNHIGAGYWKDAILVENCDMGLMMAFLKWICNNYLARRKVEKAKKKKTLNQYWRDFKMLFRRNNGGTLVDPDLSTEVVKYCNGELKNEFGLDTASEPKPVVGTDDLVRLLSYHWTLDTSTYPTEDDRLDMATLMLFQSYTGCRPAELVHAYKTKGRHDPLADPEQDGFDEDAGETSDASDYAPELNKFEEPERIYKALCYEDICLWVVQNPRRGERDLLAMEVTLRHHKGADNKPKPTIFLFREHALPLLCPISHILARAIRDDAILVDGFTTAEPFFATNLQDPEKAFKVHWRPSLLKTPVFRRSIRCVDGFKKSDTEPFPYSSYALYVNRLGKLVGFEEKLTSYGFRRCTANAVDGAATEAVRNQVLRHNPNTGVFTAYLNERVGFNVQYAVLEDPTDDGLTRAFTHMSIRCNPLAPMVVPQEVAEMLPPDPMVIEWETRRAELRDRIRDLYGPVSRAPQNEMVEEYDQLGRQITSAKKSNKDALNAVYRKEWFFNSHNEIMARQRDGIVADEYVAPVVHHQLPERARLAEALSDTRRDLPIKEIVERWVRTINLMVALGGRQEVQPRNRSQARKIDPKQESPVPIPDSDFDPFKLVLKKTQCIFCIGNERLTLDKRTRSFCRPAIMMDHVEDIHLSKVTGRAIPCGHQACKSNGLVFYGVPHFKLHVQVVHGVSLRRPPYIAETINSTRPSCLPAHVSPTYQTRAERLHHQEAEAIAVQDDMDEQFARDVERSVFRRGEHSIRILVGG